MTTTAIAVDRKPPGPRGRAVMRALSAFGANPAQMLYDHWSQYGDTVYFGRPLDAYLLVDPSDVDRVLNDYETFPRMFRDRFAVVAEDGLLTTEGQQWLGRREALNPEFRTDRFAYLPVVARCTARMLERWRGLAERGEPVLLQEEMDRLSLDILGISLVGEPDWERHGEALGGCVVGLLGHVHGKLKLPVNIPEWVPLPSNRRIVAKIKAFDEAAFGLIRERRAHPVQDGGLLSQLMTARLQDSGEPLTDEQVRDELITTFAGGQVNMPVGMTWMLYLLARQSDVAARARDEVVRMLGDGGVRDLGRLEYTGNVFKEVLRLYPPFYFYARSPTEDVELGGYRIPAGSSLFLCSYVTHRHPELWEHPEAFDPDRFTAVASAGRHGCAWFPLSVGVRDCVGGEMGVLTTLLVAALILREFELQAPAEEPIELAPTLALRPKGPLPITLRTAPRP